MRDELMRIIDAWQGKRVLVVGDVCRDQWIDCEERENPEAAAPVYRKLSTIRESWGMAELVTSLVDDVGGKACVLSRDTFAYKTRLLVDGACQLRFDRDPLEPMTECEETQVFANIAKAMPTVDAVIVSDYGKGTCTPDVLQTVFDAASAAGVPVLVDPARGTDWERYRGATWIKANMAERDDGPAVWHDLCQAMIVTDGKFGIRAHHQRSPVTMIDATPRNAVDPCGCGDACAAVLGLCLAVGSPIDLACRLANYAGGLAVEQLGTPVITARLLRDAVRCCTECATRQKQT